MERKKMICLDFDGVLHSYTLAVQGRVPCDSALWIFSHRGTRAVPYRWKKGQ